MRFIIFLWLSIFLLQTLRLVFAQETVSLPSCTNTTNLEFDDWTSAINHKKVGDMHIFHSEIRNDFSPNPPKVDFWIEFMIGPISTYVEGSFDSSKNRLELCNWAHLPVMGKKRLGCGIQTVGGRIPICFNVNLIWGEHVFFIKDEELHVYFHDVAVGETYRKIVSLIPLPVKKPL